ncbi:MAG: hypothetical protein RBS07_02235 [Lentimicrobium sp.]|jgi:hypothetical protein|nr:hypothetical protein [Lentimicrobium sp.]
MTKNEKDISDETEKALRHLIEKTKKENSALSKILKVLTNGVEPEPSEKDKKSLNKN